MHTSFSHRYELILCFISYSLLNHYPSQLESFKLDQNIPLLADPEFYAFSLEGLQNRERKIYQIHAKTDHEHFVNKL